MCVSKRGVRLAVILLAASVFAAGNLTGANAQATGAGPAAAKLFPLMVGDAAPPLAVARWIKGEPTTLERGHVYVVEFWATWCGPCLAGMAHLTELQERYGKSGVTVIGVTSQDPYGNSLEAVRDLLAKKADAVGYSIAWDDQSGTDHAYQDVFRGHTIERYLEAAQIRAIPCAFVVDREGRIAYIGHPAAMDGALEQIVAGTWDIAGAARKYRLSREAEPLLDEFTRLLESNKTDEAYGLARRLMANEIHDDWRGLLIIADAIAGSNSKVERKDIPLALEAATRANELTRYSDPGLVGLLAGVCLKSGDRAKAIELGTRAVSLAEGAQKAALQKDLDGYAATDASPQKPTP